MNCNYDSVVGVLLPVENKILPIILLTLKLTKTHPLFTPFAKNTAVVFLLVVKMPASSRIKVCFLVIAPLNYFDRDKYEYEDR